MPAKAKATTKSKGQYDEILSLDPKQIQVGWRVRSDLGPVEELAASIREIGQLHPIVVTANGKGYCLVAGMRRLKACQQLGDKVMARVVDLQDEWHELMMQLHENLRRKNFDSLEEGMGLQRSKEIYEKLHPETKLGAAGGGHPKGRVADSANLAGEKPAGPAPRFTLVVAKETGFSERKVQEYLELANLPAKYKKQIQGARTPDERESIAQECLKANRQARKLKKLEAEAEAKKQLDLEDANSAKKPAVILYYGDNKTYLKGEELYELVLTDPPYERDRSLIGHIARASIGKTLAWDKLDLGWVMRAAPMLTKGGQMLVFCPLEAIGAYELAFEAAELDYRGAIIWHKSNAGTVYRNVYLPACEAIVWATRGGKYTFHTWEEQAGAVAHNLIPGPICGGNERLGHETQKPEWLIERLLKRHTVDGQRVFDPFAGSGTTLVVCKRMGLAAVGVEKEEEYIKIAKTRLAAVK